MPVRGTPQPTVARAHAPSSGGAVSDTCNDDSDCTANPYEPYCSNGLCAPSPCGWDPALMPSCSELVDEGAPCQVNPVLGFYTNDAGASICQPGLTCRGLGSPDGAAATCVVPSDVGGACDDSAAVTGCKFGLTCSCGVCHIPPITGACATDVGCKSGTAACLPTIGGSRTCVPIIPLGDNCGATSFAIPSACESGQVCDCPWPDASADEDASSIPISCNGSQFICEPGLS